MKAQKLAFNLGFLLNWTVCFSILIAWHTNSLAVTVNSTADRQQFQIRVMTINTEWLWTPHDNVVDGGKFNKGDMSPKAYQREISFYARLVNSVNANLVAVSEIENGDVAKDLATAFGSEWRAFFKQGRDTATGQDIAILSTLDMVPGSLTDFGFPVGKLPSDSFFGKGKRLSKLVGVRFALRLPTGKDVSLAAISSHFLSKRNSTKKKDDNRLRQAYSLSRAISSIEQDAQALIVFGDLNDIRGSKPIDHLTQTHQLRSIETHCPQKVTKKYIDHILFRGVECHRTRELDLKRFSDHSAMFAVFEF